MKKRIAIIGSRDFPTAQLVEAYVASLPDDSIVVSGGAKGVDSWAVQAAENRGLEVKVFDADWGRSVPRLVPFETRQSSPVPIMW